MFVHAIGFGFGMLTLAASTVSIAPRPPAIRPSASIHTNEAEAIQMLRRIAVAEQMFRAARDIDTNCDRNGEYGYFAELAGAQPMRVSENCQPAAGSSGDILATPLLSSAFGHLPARYPGHDFIVPYKGYYFQIWLAGPTFGGITSAVREDPTGGKMAAPFPDPVNGACYWICYAWPVEYGVTGVRAFCVSQRGFVLECANGGSTVLGGLFGTPWFDEALTYTGDLASPLRLWMPGGAFSTVWTVVN